MTTIKSTFAKGGAGLTTLDHDGVSLVDTLRDIADDLLAMKEDDIIEGGNALVVDITAYRTKFVATLAKLDADAGVTDTDYASLETPAAITATAISELASIVTQLNASLTDLTAIRTKFVALLAKLDLDATVNGTNYAALWTPAALTAVAITDASQGPTLNNQLVADLIAMTTALVGVLAKLDLDSGVTDTNYAALETPAARTSGLVTALKTIKG